MMESTKTTSLQYLVSSTGDRTHVVLTLDDYSVLTEQIRMLAKKLAAMQSRSATTVSAVCPANVSNLAPPVTEQVFTYSLPRKGGSARAVWRYPTMIVLEESTIAKFETATMRDEYKKLRQRLIDSGIIARRGSELTFTCDYTFSSASEATCVVEGGSRDGYRSWRDGCGRTISEILDSRG